MQTLKKRAIEEKVRAKEAQLIGSAYIGKPTQEKALVYAFGGHEYLIPIVNKWNGANVTESLVRLDRTERVVSRPKGTSCITEMKRSKKISSEAKLALAQGVKAWFIAETGYVFCIIPFPTV